MSGYRPVGTGGSGREPGAIGVDPFERGPVDGEPEIRDDDRVPLGIEQHPRQVDDVQPAYVQAALHPRHPRSQRARRDERPVLAHQRHAAHREQARAEVGIVAVEVAHEPGDEAMGSRVRSVRPQLR